MPESFFAEGVGVIMYGRGGKPSCTDCDAARAVINKARVPYTYIDIRENPNAQILVTKVCEAHGRSPAVPVIVIHHHTPQVDGVIVFIEPRGLGLQALASTLSTFRIPFPRA